MRSFGKCIHCFFPVLIWAAVSGGLLIATHSLWREEKMIFPFAFHLLPFRSDTSLHEKAEFPLDAKDIIVFLLVLLCLPFTVCNTFGVRMEISRDVSWSDLWWQSSPWSSALCPKPILVSLKSGTDSVRDWGGGTFGLSVTISFLAYLLHPRVPILLPPSWQK